MVVVVNDTTRTFITAKQKIPLITMLPILSAFWVFPFFFIWRWNSTQIYPEEYEIDLYMNTTNIYTQTLKIIPMPTPTCTNNDKMIRVALIINVFSSELYVIRNLSWFAFAVNNAISIIPYFWWWWWCCCSNTLSSFD